MQSFSFRPTTVVPSSCIEGPDGRIWGSDSAGNFVAITTAGVETDYPQSGVATYVPQGIAVGTDGSMWSADSGGTIFRITTSGTAVGTYAPGGIQEQQFLTTGPGPYIWQTSPALSGSLMYIRRFDMSGTLTSFSVSSPSFYDPSYAILGNDGTYLYVVAAGQVPPTYALSYYFYKVDSSGTFTLVTTSAPNDLAYTNISCFDGTDFWVAANAGVYKVTVTGTFTYYSITGMVGPSGVCYDGTNLWISAKDGIYYTTTTAPSSATKVTLTTGNSYFSPINGPGGIWVADFTSSGFWGPSISTMQIVMSPSF